MDYETRSMQTTSVISIQHRLPDPGDVWDDSLDKLKEFFEGLMPGNNEEKPRNEESNNGDIEGEDGNNGDNHYDDFDDEHVTDVSD